jgi:predicted nucleic acid-binding protein
LSRLIDTNVFVYAAGGQHPLRSASVRLLTLVAKHPEDFTVDLEVIQEVLHVYARRGERVKAVSMVELILGLFPDPIAVGAGEIRFAAQLLVEHPRLSARDAIHAAVVLHHGLDAIVTADRDFAAVPGLRSLDPQTAAAT